MIARLVIAFACTGALAAPAAATLEPGNWRLTVKSTTNGVDDASEEEVCLRADELRDLARYFAPALEGVQATCTTVRQPGGAPGIIRHRLRCTGNGFTYEATSEITVQTPARFLMSFDSRARTARETGVVSMRAEAVRLGPCNKPATAQEGR